MVKGNFELMIGIPRLVKAGVLYDTGQKRKNRRGDLEPMFKLTPEFTKHFYDQLIESVGIPGHIRELENKYNLASKSLYSHGLLESIHVVKTFYDIKGGEIADDELEIAGRIVEAFLIQGGLFSKI